MKIQIKACFDNRVLYECEAESMLEGLQQAVQEKASLVGASLAGARLDGARLDGAILDRASLVGARLVGASLVGASLDWASLDRAILDRASLDRASLDRANLDRASLVGARLVGACLNGACLNGASLDGASLGGACLNGARLVGAILDGKPILDAIQVLGIGSARRCTTMIVLPESEVIYCGCFRGSLAELEAAIEKTHAGNPKFLTQYRAAVAFLNVCREEARKGA